MADKNIEDNNDNIDNVDNVDNVDDIDNTDNKEEYSMDDILGDDGDESEDITEAEDVSEILKRSETLQDPDAGGETESHINDLNALDDFTDDAGDGNQSENENTEEAIAAAEEAAKQKRAKKIKFIKRVSLVTAICAFLIAGGLIAWMQINKYTNSYALTFYDRKIKMDDFQFFLIRSASQDYSDPKQDSIDQILFYLSVGKAAKDRNIELSEEEISEIAESSFGAQEEIHEYFPTADNISLEFLQEIIGIEYLYYKLMEQIPDELGYTFNEAEFLVALADYVENGKAEYTQTDFKYIIADTLEAAEESKKAIESGDLPTDDAIRQYSVAYSNEEGEEYGFDTLPLNMMSAYGIPSEDVDKLIYLEEGEPSHIVSLGEDTHVVFIPSSVYRPSEAEIKETFQQQYEEDQKYNMFVVERDRLIAEDTLNAKINDKALENFDLDALMESMQSPVLPEEQMDMSDYNY